MHHSTSTSRHTLTRVFSSTRARRAWSCGLALLALAGGTDAAYAARFRVGAGRTFATLEAAINGHTYGAGDSILLDAGTFQPSAMLRPLGSGTPGHPIVVRGAGAGSTTVSGAALTNSKALWDVEQNNSWWVFEDLKVSGMRGAQTNARGFFLVGCADVVVQRCEVTDCWNGFMSASGATRVTVQYCNVHHNGGLQGPAHNFYMSGGSDFVIQYNWIHDSQYGTCYKDRTHNLRLQYNRIENAAIEGYEVSLAGDGTGDQGETLLLGNVIVKSPSSAQQTHFVRFEDGRGGTLRLVHNTLVGQPRNVLVSSIASSTILDNNVFWSGASVFGGTAAVGHNNWTGMGRDAGGLVGSLHTAAPGFANAAGGDYRLARGSVCIDAGDPSVTPQPTAQWNSSSAADLRGVVGRAPDVGAFEAPFGSTALRELSWSAVKSQYR